MRLSKHFTLEEMCKSQTAVRKGIDNTPGSGEVKNLENVCYEILEPVRNKYDKPLTMPLNAGINLTVAAVRRAKVGKCLV